MRGLGGKRDEEGRRTAFHAINLDVFSLCFVVLCLHGWHRAACLFLVSASIECPISSPCPYKTILGLRSLVTEEGEKGAKEEKIKHNAM